MLGARVARSVRCGGSGASSALGRRSYAYRSGSKSKGGAVEKAAENMKKEAVEDELIVTPAGLAIGAIGMVGGVFLFYGLHFYTKPEQVTYDLLKEPYVLGNFLKAYEMMFPQLECRKVVEERKLREKEAKRLREEVSGFSEIGDDSEDQGERLARHMKIIERDNIVPKRNKSLNQQPFRTPEERGRALEDSEGGDDESGGVDDNGGGRPGVPSGEGNVEPVSSSGTLDAVVPATLTLSSLSSLASTAASTAVSAVQAATMSSAPTATNNDATSKLTSYDGSGGEEIKGAREDKDQDVTAAGQQSDMEAAKLAGVRPTSDTAIIPPLAVDSQPTKLDDGSSSDGGSIVTDTAASSDDTVAEAKEQSDMEAAKLAGVRPSGDTAIISPPVIDDGSSSDGESIVTDTAVSSDDTVTEAKEAPVVETIVHVTAEASDVVAATVAASAFAAVEAERKVMAEASDVVASAVAAATAAAVQTEVDPSKFISFVEHQHFQSIAWEQVALLEEELQRSIDVADDLHAQEKRDLTKSLSAKLREEAQAQQELMIMEYKKGETERAKQLDLLLQKKLKQELHRIEQECANKLKDASLAVEAKRNKEVFEMVQNLDDLHKREARFQVHEAKAEAEVAAEIKHRDALQAERNQRLQVAKDITIRIKALERILNEQATREGISRSVHGLWIAAHELASSIHHGRPLMEDIASLRSLEIPFVDATLNVFEGTVGNEILGQGLVTDMQLNRAFPGLKEEAHAVAALRNETSFYQYIVSHITWYLTLKSVYKGPNVEGDNVHAVLGRAEHLLESQSDMTQVLTEMDGLTGASRNVFKEWVARLRARIVGEQLAAAINAHAVCAALNSSESS